VNVGVNNNNSLLVGSTPGEDITLLGEVALRGTLLELPEILSFRRFDQEKRHLT
jgi:hypothetical protein